MSFSRSGNFCDYFKPGESRKPTVNIIATVESAECSVLPLCWNYKKSDLFSLKLTDKVCTYVINSYNKTIWHSKLKVA